jgi:hypothetical protein
MISSEKQSTQNLRTSCQYLVNNTLIVGCCISYCLCIIMYIVIISTGVVSIIYKNIGEKYTLTTCKITNFDIFNYTVTGCCSSRKVPYSILEKCKQCDLLRYGVLLELKYADNYTNAEKIYKFESHDEVLEYINTLRGNILCTYENIFPKNLSLDDKDYVKISKNLEIAIFISAGIIILTTFSLSVFFISLMVSIKVSKTESV